MKKRISKHLPNAITCANLFSGCVGIVFTFQENLIFAAYALFLAAIFVFIHNHQVEVQIATSSRLHQLAKNITVSDKLRQQALKHEDEVEQISQ